MNDFYQFTFNILFECLRFPDSFKINDDILLIQRMLVVFKSFECRLAIKKELLILEYLEEKYVGRLSLKIHLL